MEFADFQKLVMQSRSTRRFKNDKPVSISTLRGLIELARMVPSSKNLQPLKYILVNERQACEAVFSCLGWAKSLTNWNGPSSSERPVAYIVILGDKDINESFSCDHGISAQTMMLGARSHGLAGCIIASINRENLRGLLRIGERFEILLIIALGEPGEKIILEPLSDGENTNYWRDEKQVHHVPKRSVEELVLMEYSAEL